MIIEGKKYDYELVLDREHKQIRLCLLKELPNDGHEIVDEAYCSSEDLDAIVE